MQSSALLCANPDFLKMIRYDSQCNLKIRALMKSAENPSNFMRISGKR